MAAAKLNQEPDSIVQDTQSNKCNKLEAPCCENEVVNNSTESETDFKIVSSCILCCDEDNELMIQCTKCKSWLYYYRTNLPKLSSTDVLNYPKKVYLLSVFEVSKEIHAVCKNFSEIDILKTENKELREQLKTVKDENKLEVKRIALLMKEAEGLRDSSKKGHQIANRNK